MDLTLSLILAVMSVLLLWQSLDCVDSVREPYRMPVTEAWLGSLVMFVAAAILGAAAVFIIFVPGATQ